MSKRPLQGGCDMSTPELTVDVAATLRRGDLVADAVFDAVYSATSRAASAHYWTSVAVAKQAAAWFAQAGARRVLDVGSGVGKFAIVASLAADLDVCGVEHRAHLVAEASAAAAAYGAPARFTRCTIAGASPLSYDGFYLYNPFGENLVHPCNRLDATVRLGRSRFARDVERVEAWLARAKVGTAVITYNGFGGRIPASFELASSLPAGNCHLRLWTKQRPQCPVGEFFVEHRGIIVPSQGSAARGAQPVEDSPARAAVPTPS